MLNHIWPDAPYPLLLSPFLGDNKSEIGNRKGSAMKKLKISLLFIAVAAAILAGCNRPQLKNEDYSMQGIYNGTWVDRVKVKEEGNFAIVNFPEDGQVAELTLGLKSKDNKILLENKTKTTIRGNGDGPFTIEDPALEKPVEGTISLRGDEIVISINGLDENQEKKLGLHNGTKLYSKVDYQLK
jgi:predicted peptidase